MADFLQEMDGDFASSGGSFNSIELLKLTSNNIYLCLGGVSGCGTCYAEIASVLELTDDSINLQYSAFQYSVNDVPEHNSSSAFVLDSRGNIKKFEFDEKTQTISYVYETDDNTPIVRDEDGKSKTITGTLKWNGREFIETIKGNK